MSKLEEAKRNFEFAESPGKTAKRYVLLRVACNGQSNGRTDMEFCHK